MILIWLRPATQEMQRVGYRKALESYSAITTTTEKSWMVLEIKESFSPDKNTLLRSRPLLEELHIKEQSKDIINILITERKFAKLLSINKESI